MKFSELGLAPLLQQRLEALGFSGATDIQQQVFPEITQGKSVLALSKTGTGKTYAYMLPLLSLQLSTGPDSSTEKSRGRIVVLVPTRELANQVKESFEKVASPELKASVIIGGESEERQISEARHSNWVIATPGRLLDLLNRRLIPIQDIRAVVFDEADRILDMGFVDDVRAILRLLPKSQQMLFFSATLHFGVDEMAYEFGADFSRIGQEADEMTVEGLDHRVAFIGDHEKFHALAHFLSERKEQRGIVFSNYREAAHGISSRLRGLGARVESLTAALNQGARTRIMQEFREHKIQVLVASDLAARGLDVHDLDFVVNFDLPDDPSTYVHRVGRTARAGKKGIAVSFVGFEDSFRLERLERFLSKKIERMSFDSSKFQGALPRLGQTRSQPKPPSHQPKPPSHRISTVNKTVRPPVESPALSPQKQNLWKRFTKWLKALLSEKPKSKAGAPSSASSAQAPSTRRTRPAPHRRRGASRGGAGGGRPRTRRPT